MLDLLIMVKTIKRYVSKPSFVSQKIFSKNLVAIHEIKPVLTLDKLIYAGFSILDLSKLLMYQFYYKYYKKYNANLLFTDTDSFVYVIETNDVHEIFMKIKVYLISVTIQKSQIFFVLPIKKWLVKWKMNLKEK